MIIQLPISRETFNEETKQIEIKKDTLPVSIDVSAYAHLKWEEHFQSSVGCDLTTYTERIQKIIQNDKEKHKNQVQSEILSMLKLLYCYVSSEQLPTFKDFVKLFNVNDIKNITDKLTIVFQQISHTASKN